MKLNDGVKIVDPVDFDNEILVPKICHKH